MRKIVLTLMAGVLTMTLFAQKAKNNMGTKATWKRGGFVTLSVNQGGFDNWVPSGDADYSIGLNGYLNLYANREWGGKRKGKKKTWTNSFEALQAFQGIHDERTDENRFDKLEDRIDFISRYRVGVTKKLGIGSLAEARTQLYDTKRDGKRVSGFFAPATVIAAPLGMDWQPCEGFSLFLTPAAGRWIFVTNGPYSINQTYAELQGKPANTNVMAFGVNPDREVDPQFGAFASLVLNKPLDKAKKVTLRSRLDLYANYLGTISNVDVFFTNFLSMKVNKWLNVGVNLDMIYDDDVKQFGWNRNKAGLQYKHIIGIGAGFKF